MLAFGGEGGAPLLGAVSETQKSELDVIESEIQQQSEPNVQELYEHGMNAVLASASSKETVAAARFFGMNMDSNVLLSGVQFCPDCGYGDVQNLWNPESAGGVKITQRAIWAMLGIVLCVYNFYFLVSTDLKHLSQTVCSAEIVRDKPFLVSESIVEFVRHIIDDHGEPWAIECNGARLVGYLELFGLGILLARVGLQFWHIFRCSKSNGVEIEKLRLQEYIFWNANVELFWIHIPTLGSYSGMKMLQVITPWILIQDIKLIQYTMQAFRRKFAFFRFFLGRAIYVIIGFDMFLVRFRAASVYALSSELTMENFMQAFIFMRQVLGIVEVNMLLQRRLFSFIFGGEENTMDIEELAKKAAWRAKVASEIWRHALEEQYSLLKYLIVMFSFTDVDIQKLILEPNRNNMQMVMQQNRLKHGSDDKI